ISGAHRSRPAELVEAGSDDSAHRLQLAPDQKPHGERGGMPAARRQAAENRRARGVVVEVKRLRIELRGETLDPLRVHMKRVRPEDLSDGKIFEIVLGHDGSVVGMGAGYLSMFVGLKPDLQPDYKDRNLRMRSSSASRACWNARSRG